MPEPAILTGISFVILIGTYALTSVMRARRIRQVAWEVLQKLVVNEAFGPFTAVDLPQAKPIPYRRIGYKNFHPIAMEVLTHHGLVKRTGNGKFFLNARSAVHRRTVDCLRGGGGPDQSHCTLPGIEP